ERQGDGTQAARLLQGLGVGARGRGGRERPDRHQPLAQGLRHRKWPPDRHDVRRRGVRPRRHRPHHRRAHHGRGVPAGRRRHPRHRPGERLPLGGARPRDRVRQVGRAGHRQAHVPGDAARGVLRWRCGLRAEEHHLGGRARPPGRHFHPPSLPGRDGERAAGARHQPAEPQDGHARVELRQRLHRGGAAADAARLAQGALQEAQHRGRAGLHRRAGGAGGAALPQLRRADGVQCQAVHRVRRLPRHLPGRLPHHHPQRRRVGAAYAPQGTGAEPDPAAVRVRRPAADRARHGQGRGPVRALRVVRRALPDRRLGHAEVRAALDARPRRSRRARFAQTQDRLKPMPPVSPARVNDFSIKIATVNGTGSASANTLLMKSIFRSGIPVMGKNYFPSNIQGLPTWYEIRVTKDGHVARSGKIDLMVAMNPETYARDVKEVEPGGYLVYDSTWPRPALLKREDITVLGVPLAQLCNENFSGVRTRILMKNICYAGVLAALLELDLGHIRTLLAETYAKKPQLVESNMKAIQLGYDYARTHFPCPLPLRVEKMDRTAGHIMIDGNTAAALGCIFAGATVADWYPITPSTSLMDAFKMFADRMRVDQATGRKNFAFIQAEDELAAIGMVIGAMWNGARAFTATSGPGISLMNEFLGLAYYAEVPAVIFDIQRVGPS